MKYLVQFITYFLMASTNFAMEKQTPPLHIFLCDNTLHEDISLHIKSLQGALSIINVNAGTKQYIFQPADVEIQIIAESDKKVLATFDLEPSKKIFNVTMHDAQRTVYVSNSYTENTPLLQSGSQVFSEYDNSTNSPEAEIKNSGCLQCTCQ